MEYIKANIPASMESYRSGNGEGCYFLVTEEVKRAYDQDEDNTNYVGILANDSLYYPELKAGAEVPLEMRGSFRPVVPYEWLQKSYKYNKDW